jgi:nucleotide-binding universal stress UspA family protein
MFKTILFPTKFEEFSLPILKSILCLEKAGLEEVILLHVIDTDSLYTEVDGGLPFNIDYARAAVEKHLSTYAGYLQSKGVRVRTEVVTGRLVSEILRTAAENNVSLIVAGRQKRDILGELFVGSTTDRIIRKAEAPVLVAKYHTVKEIEGEVYEHYCVDMFRKVLYPTDWSACAERVKEYLPVLHNVGVSQIVVVHVIEDHLGESNYLDVNLQRALQKNGEAKLEALKEELQAAGFQVKTLLLQGKPYKEINRVATKEDVSLIVMGSHGKGVVEGILWGSVSQRVVEYSEKPVLVVK